MELSSRIQQINDIDRVIHEPVRLAILMVLASVKEADFNFLITALGVTKGNLATHVRRLEEAEYVAVNKTFRDRIPHTSYQITRTGCRELQRYWENIDKIKPS